MSAPSSSSVPLARWRSVGFRVLSLVGAILGPAAASLLVLRYCLPSRLEGAAGGTLGVLAWLGDAHPLFVGVGLFLLFSEAGRYWVRRSPLGGDVVVSAAPANRPRARYQWR